MAGLVALVGSGEFLPAMRETDTLLLGDHPGRVIHLPTAAGQEGPTALQRWESLAASHYATMGREVVTLPVIDDTSADDRGLAAEIDQNTALVYLSGGNPAHCARTLRNSKVWEAVLKAWQGGTSLAGCSAGAGALTTVAPNQRGGKSEPGLGPVSYMAVIPHYDRARFIRPLFLRTIRSSAPNGTEVVGIEEDTALVGRPGEDWTVTGHQSVVLVDRDHQRFQAGSTVRFDR